jgi:hypothetical protein
MTEIKPATIITTALVQAGVTEVFLIVYNFWIFRDVLQATTFTAALLLFVTIFSAPLQIILWEHNFFVKMILINLIVAPLCVAAFLLYPQALGYEVDMWALMFLLMLSGLIAFTLVYQTSREMRPNTTIDITE